MRVCVFCRITNEKAAAFRVYEDESTVGFLDIHPFTLGHTLVCCKSHFENIREMPDELVEKLFVAVKRVAQKVRSGMIADGINYLINEGTAANQIVPHVHVHIIPRKHGDQVSYRQRLTVQENDLRAVADRISNS